jgi:Icc-related predicted phosphoesterase
MMLIGALADIHGNFDAMRAAMERHRDVPFWVCVGDVASRSGTYPDPPAPLYWIKGNNENFDRIAAWEAGRDMVANLHFIPNGTSRTVGPLIVAGLGGTYAPTWYNTAAAQLPHKAGDDKRRHFVREQVEACKQMRGIDILMTHEAARPFVIVDEPKEGRKPVRRDAGKPAINDVLASMKPRLHLCGHHHRFVETLREGVRSVCIDRVNRSYLLIDASTLEYQKVEH